MGVFGREKSRCLLILWYCWWIWSRMVPPRNFFGVFRVHKTKNEFSTAFCTFLNLNFTVFRPIRKFKKVQKAVEVGNVSIFQPSSSRFGISSTISISCINKISKSLNSNFKKMQKAVEKYKKPSYSTAFCTFWNFLIGLQ